MKRTMFVFVIIICILLLLTGCGKPGNESAPPVENAFIAKQPPVMELGRGSLPSLPSYNKYSSDPFQLDLRGYDLTALDTGEDSDALIHAVFDTRTKWPYKLPGSFNPKLIMEYGKNPGMNIRSLHKQGINGNGVGVAIIDSSLLVEHNEYKDRLKLYEEVNCLDKTASVSGCAAASIAVGRTVGVAPGAELYYIAETHVKTVKDHTVKDFTWLSRSIDRVVEINKGLPEGNKIRVLCVDTSWLPNIPPNDEKNEVKNYDDVMKAVERAKKNGIFVVSSSVYEIYDADMDFNGLGRDPLKDPDSFLSFKPGLEWETKFFLFGRYTRAKEALLAPMDSRTAASPTGKGDYAFYPMGNLKYPAAYIAGLYALACQIKPDITPEDFWQEALKTGEVIEVKHENINHVFKMKKVINPLKLIESLKK